MLWGGDTTSTPGPLTLSLTLIGHVAPGQAVRRRGARPGDIVWVTGTIGDGALGLAVATGRLDDPTGFLLDRYRLPRPRLRLAIADIVNAGLDVSDGLVQDLGHICRASGVAAEIEAARLPLSDATRRAGATWLRACLTGGDDYELLLAVPPERQDMFLAAAASAAIPVTAIGQFREGAAGDVRVLDPAGSVMAFEFGGWSHF